MFYQLFTCKMCSCVYFVFPNKWKGKHDCPKCKGKGVNMKACLLNACKECKNEKDIQR